MKHEDINPEEAMKQVQKIFKKRGTKALEMARKQILQDKIECKEAKEALTYFITQYWHDLARPSLLSMVCEAVGGDPELTTPIAVPLILISGAIDIHDDIIDQSKTKAGRLTVYGRYGRDVALLVGDALLFKGLILLNKAVENSVPAKKMSTVVNIVQKMFFELGDAEALELPLRGQLDVSMENYLEIVRKKAADVEAHTRIGAILGGASKREIEALGKYGRLLGMLIILRDDWFDIIDLEEIRHRVKRECLPLPIFDAIKDTRGRSQLHSILLKKTMTKEDVKSILETTYKVGAVKRFEELIIRLVQDAYSELKTLRRRTYHLELLTLATLPPLEKRENEVLTPTTKLLQAP